jgi:hypothetical protein
VADALLRLGTLAGEAQQVIDAHVARLVRVAVRTGSPRAISIDCRPLADEPRHVVRELLLTAWRDAGWPLQAMGYDSWERLAELLQQPLEPATVRIALPGSVTAQKTGEELSLTRLV